VTREELISICERASVPEDEWRDRDSEGAQRQVGECLMLLRAGCEFKVHTRRDDPASSTRTIWVTARSRGFGWYERDDEAPASDPFRYHARQLYYLPTEKRLRDAAGGDWYC